MSPAINVVGVAFAITDGASSGSIERILPGAVSIRDGGWLPDVNDFNQQIIDEFRANHGRVGGGFEGAPILLLHTTGAKTGEERVHPLTYQRDGERYAVFASKAGAPTNPDWFHNLRANPRVTVELGDETFPADARIAEGEEHERLWTRQKQDMPGFAEYEATTTRQIPVVVLERVTG